MRQQECPGQGALKAGGKLMESQCELSRIDGLGSVVRFPCGRVTVTVPGISLHLTEDAFVLFASMVAKAKLCYMDKSLREMAKDQEHG
jgi:hypothetical protein